MNFKAFEFYWLLAEQQKLRGNTKLAESFYKKAMEAAKVQDSPVQDGAYNHNSASLTNEAHSPNLQGENLSSSK